MPAQLLMSKPLLYGAGALLVSGLTAFGVQTWRLHTLQAQLATAESDSVVCEASVGRLEDQITWQNNRVTNQAKQAEVLRDRLDTQAEDGLKTPLPTTPPGVDELNRWLNKS